MNFQEFLDILKDCPLIASVQASPGSPLDDTETLLKLAQASVSQGVRILRLEGVENIKRIRAATGCPTIGLIKRKYPDREHYITPTMREVEELLETGCEVIAIDSRLLDYTGLYASERSQARCAEFEAMVERCHREGRLVLADCSDSSMDLEVAHQSGVDICSTTFTSGRWGQETFQQHSYQDLGYFIRLGLVPVLAEGLVHTEAQVRWAMQMGARGVVVGGALNDPIKTTARFVKAAKTSAKNVGAVDIGGTWLRFGLFSPDWKLINKTKVKLPQKHADRLKWIEKQANTHEVGLVGVATGGVVEPRLGFMQSSKDTIPDNRDARFWIDGIEIRALNDGLASAWGHLVHGSRENPRLHPGEHTVTIALGTGVGCGITSGFGLAIGYNYPRLNDLEFERGNTFEDVLGGLALGLSPTLDQQDLAVRALERAIDIFFRLLQPEAVYLCGGVAFSPWLRKRAKNMVMRSNVHFSPFGEDAGLYGAAALALFPPIGVFPE